MKKVRYTDGQQFSEDRFTKIDFLKTPNTVAFILNFLPGQHMKPHMHPNRELYLFVVEGSGTLIIDDEEQIVQQGDVLFCQADEKIGFTNTSDARVSLYGIMAKIPPEGT